MTRRRRRHSYPARGGWSLVEMLCVVTLTTLLSVMCTRYMILFFEIDSAAGIEALRELTLQHLEDDLRSICDLATAVETAVEDERPVLLVRGPENRLASYAFADGRVEKTVTGVGDLGERELFDLSPHEVQIEVRSEGTSSIVALTVRTVIEGKPGSLYGRIEAVVGTSAAGDREVTP